MEESNIPFQLTPEEQAVLSKYLKFYRALAKGMRRPATPEQKHFVDVISGRAPAKTVHETAYIKYVRHRKQIESFRSERDPQSDGPTDDWFTREDWKKLRGRQRWDGR